MRSWISAASLFGSVMIVVQDLSFSPIQNWVVIATAGKANHRLQASDRRASRTSYPEVKGRKF
jgi:hypothetical protein